MRKPPTLRTIAAVTAGVSTAQLRDRQRGRSSAPGKMVSVFSSDYFEVKKKGGLSQFQTMMAYLGGSALQTVGDNPVTAYRQLVQQYAKDLKGEPPQCPAAT